jgi:transcriptional regulator GlxA family with amidase domain
MLPRPAHRHCPAFDASYTGETVPKVTLSLRRFAARSGEDSRVAMRTFGLLLLPDFPLLAFASVLDPLRSANYGLPTRRYAWFLLSDDGDPVSASCGLRVPIDARLQAAKGLDDLIVVAGNEACRYSNPDTLAALRRLARKGCRIGGVSLGSFLLARAGLLTGYRCTLHWANLDSFREEFPTIEARPSVYEIDRDRYSCAGGTAALDMMLALIAQDHGRAAAIQVADNLIYHNLREGGEAHRMSPRNRFGASHPKLLEAIALMEVNTEETLSRAQLADRVGISQRQLERLFKKYLGRTPSNFYLQTRLARARALILQSTMPILDVAIACGFVSHAHFTKVYRQHFGCTPSEDRASQRVA